MEINEFLVKAKINTYAASGEGGESVLADGCKELLYKEAEWNYRDRYFGFDPFIGEEIVFRDGQAVWGMNYYGRVISGIVEPRQIFCFLKKALRLVSEDRPFRGPAIFQEGDWSYANASKGEVDKFEGTETVSFNGKVVHELKYHGGNIAG
ncbi:MAG TPA: DUF5680 domain-containing protein [Candidatus Paceibacterota bacterium]|nr:DUF5680 domain-containing protein [Candidatus Pacearchaeota archaeon]HRZ50658.1 DUF5680 domain-containing protein [Candidatus Paceibacterota bacterium]HSA36445.1 DUF5680 domain-containing protein [Candidatus Paceibacterota bacterium]